jgi:predicted metal-dependent RNase
MADTPTLSVTMLGAGQEVGRSCCVLQYRGKTIVCDTGVHPAYSGMASLPFVDELDWSIVDAILITQCVCEAMKLPHNCLTPLKFSSRPRRRVNLYHGKGVTFMQRGKGQLLTI